MAATKKKKKIESIILLGRRWRQKTYGNTYNSVEIFVNGKRVAKVGKGYGYGDHYETRGAEWLQEHGYVKLEKYSNGGHESLWRYCKENGIEYEREAIDVSRERDL